MEDTSKQNKKGLENNDNQEITNTEEENKATNKAMEEIRQMLYSQKKNKKGEQIKDSYKFWDTQPVPKINSEDQDTVGPIETDNDVEKERKEPYPLPKGFTWWDVDINKDSDLTKVKFLNDNLSYMNFYEIIM
jgi:glycylpeptide N-tetradecanoyltransferase